MSVSASRLLSPDHFISLYILNCIALQLEGKVFVGAPAQVQARVCNVFSVCVVKSFSSFECDSVGFLVFVTADVFTYWMYDLCLPVQLGVREQR